MNSFPVNSPQTCFHPARALCSGAVQIPEIRRPRNQERCDYPWQGPSSLLETLLSCPRWDVFCPPSVHEVLCPREPRVSRNSREWPKQDSRTCPPPSALWLALCARTPFFLWDLGNTVGVPISLSSIRADCLRQANPHNETNKPTSSP